MGFCQWFTYFNGRFKFTHVAEIKLSVAIQIPITKMEFIRLLTIINKTNDLILNLTPENVTQHSRIVTTTRKGSSTPTKKIPWPVV